MELPELREDLSNLNRTAIQETTFTKDVLARFQCNTLDEVKAAVATPATEFSAIVIGSGMYGAFCAERIYRRGGRALVLEAGPFVVSEHVQNMADPAFEVVEADGLLGQSTFGDFRSPVFQKAKRPINFVGQNYNVGGKSVRWGGWAPRLTEEDLKQWPEEMANYFRDFYREIEFQIGAFPTADFINGPLTDVIYGRVKPLKGTLQITDVLPAPIAVQAEQPASGLFSFDKYSSLPLLIEALRGDAKTAFKGALDTNDVTSRRGLILVPRCRVLRLETEPTSDGKQRVSHLRVIHGHGMLKIDLLPVPAGCSVVLAANSMESTRLALESFVAPQDAASTRIGRNFQVHLRTDITVRIPRVSFDADLKAVATRFVEARNAANLRPEQTDTRPTSDQVNDLLASLQTAAIHIQCSTGTRRFHVQLIAVSDPSGDAEGLLYRQDTSLPELTAALGSMRSSWIAVKFVRVGEVLTADDRDTPVGGESTNWVNLSEPERDTLVGVGDPNVVSQQYSARKLYSHIRLTQADEDFWLEMDRTALRVAQALAGEHGRIEYFYKVDPADEKSPRWTSAPPTDAQLRGLHQSLGSTYHECGTMWMDRELGKGVVSSFGRFLDVENAYCCDQSVFTTSGSANPVPTGLVVAKRVSEAIMPDHVEDDPTFTDLFDFPEPTPARDYTALPVELGQMPSGWKFIGNGRFVRRGNMVETAGGIGLLHYANKLLSTTPRK